MATATSAKKANTTVQTPTLPSPVRMQQEMMIMRETDQWMCEHYKNRT